MVVSIAETNDDPALQYRSFACYDKRCYAKESSPPCSKQTYTTKPISLPDDKIKCNDILQASRDVTDIRLFKMSVIDLRRDLADTLEVMQKIFADMDHPLWNAVNHSISSYWHIESRLFLLSWHDHYIRGFLDNQEEIYRWRCYNKTERDEVLRIKLRQRLFD